MKTAIFFLSTGCLLALLNGCASTGPKFEARAKTATLSAATVTNDLSPELLRPSDHFFMLGPGDQLEIEIVGNAASRAAVTVGPDGRIYFNLLPGLDVWGLTIPQSKSLLEKELARYLTEPQVTVTLKAVTSKSVWLLGRLNRPGVYPKTGPMTLLDSIALAGGASRSTSQITTEELADLRHSFVVRQGQFIPVDFYRLLREGDMSQNIYLQPDDFVYVPSALAQEVYVFGAVKAPRAVPYGYHRHSFPPWPTLPDPRNLIFFQPAKWIMARSPRTRIYLTSPSCVARWASSRSNRSRQPRDTGWPSRPRSRT